MHSNVMPACQACRGAEQEKHLELPVRAESMFFCVMLVRAWEIETHFSMWNEVADSAAKRPLFSGFSVNYEIVD